MTTYDVLVLGLGGMGSAAAFHCARRGARVLGLEQFGAAHDRGSSHGEWRVYREAYFEHPSYVPLAVRAGKLWEELERGGGVSLFRRCGALMLSPPESPVYRGCLESAQSHCLPHQVLDAAEVRAFFPMFQAENRQMGFFEPRAGAVRVEESIRTHLRLAEASGAILRFGEKILQVSDDSGGTGVKVETNEGVYHARKLISCAGAWSGQILAECGIELQPRRVVQAWFAANSDALPPHQAVPVVFLETAEGTWFYGLPPPDPLAPGAAWKFAFHNRHEACDPNTVRRTIDPTEISELREHIERFFPDLIREHLRASVCLYELTPDAHFVLGPHPRRPAVIVAGGFSGHGFKFTPVIGEILADLALTGHTAHDIALLCPTRPRTTANSQASILRIPNNHG